MPVTLPVLTSWRFATVARGCHIVEWPRNRWITSLGNRSTEDSSSSATRAASLRSHSASDDAFKQHNLRPLTLRDRGGHSKSQGFVRFASRSVWSVHWKKRGPATTQRRTCCVIRAGGQFGRSPLTTGRASSDEFSDLSSGQGQQLKCAVGSG